MNIHFLILFHVLISQTNGVEKNLGMGHLIDYERKLLQESMEELKANIQKGEEFAAKM